MRPAVAILGPTASGKTALALELARHFPIEVISVDSALVYRGMDIGTAKPTPEERAAVAHHLIDIIDPVEAYSAARFVEDSTALCDAILRRGHLPLFVGGTLLYWKAFVDGIDDLPRSSPAMRQDLLHEGQRLGWPAMHARLALIDPVTALRLQTQDSQRILRALEVFQATGQPLSTLLTGAQRQPGDAARQRGFALTAIGLYPEDRALLHTRIAKRFDLMLDQGFLDEVRRLRRRADLNPEMPSIRAVGYRQAWEHLDQNTAIEDFREKAIAATRQLAKRQITWLRGLSGQLMLLDPFSPSTALTLHTVVSQAFEGLEWFKGPPRH